MPPAWLFDVYPHPREPSLVVWIKHGAKTYRQTVPYRPDFCVRSDAQPLEVAERLLKEDDRVERTWRTQQRLWLRGPEEEVLRVRPWDLHDVYFAAQDLRRATKTKGFLFFDVDHQPESRWMHEQSLFSMCRLATEGGLPVLKAAPGEDRWMFDYPNPDLRTVRLEATSRVLGYTKSFDDPLESITLGDQKLLVPTIGDERSERATLLEFGKRLRALDPDVIITHHGDRWDIPFLLQKIHDHKLEGLVRLGRDPDPRPDRPDQKAQSIHTYGRWLFKTHAFYLRGRWHIDLSKKTLDADDDRKDLHGILYMTRLSNRRAQDVNRNGAGYALQQMQIDSATDQGVALPWKRNLAEDWKDAATLCAVDRGGQIMVPTPGIYEDVVACDFSGYYPSIVVRHNLSSDTINCACCPDGPIVPELNYHVCNKHKGHQSGILARMQPHRRLVKAILRKAANGGGVDDDVVAKARAIKAEQKALGVVCFGYFRYRNARFGCAEVHQAIQCYGRWGMTRAREVAQELGFKMVHTMTDCVFLQRKGAKHADAVEVARAISKATEVMMDVESVYKWVVFLPSKTHSTSSEVGVPNRYYGLFGSGQLKVRGIDVQKHVTPGWIYDTQQAMLDVFATANSAAEFRAKIPQALDVAKRAASALRERKIDPNELGLTIQSTRRVDEYQANTNTKFALQSLLHAGTVRNPGEYVKYVVARRDGPHPSRAIPIELMGESTLFGKRTAQDYHVESYTRLLARSVETILAPFGYTEDGVLEWLLGHTARALPSAVRRITPRSRPPFRSETGGRS
jgi:DNA polymerase elongation subunit (family B)